MTIAKANFPENTLVYLNQDLVLLVKGGGQAIYLQLIPIANPDLSINLEKHVLKENETLFYVPVYNKATGLYGRLTKKLAHITLRGDDSEHFHSYGYSKEKKTLLYCTMKPNPLPNIFHCTAFKKHHGFILDENPKKAKFSKIILYLPSTLDRKEDFLQWKDHIHLHPIDVSYDKLKKVHNDGEKNPALLDHKELRKNFTGGYYQSKIWFEILMLTFQMAKKLIQITSFLGLMILISKGKINFSLAINF